MAVTNRNSDVIANIVATPRVRNNSHVAGNVRSTAGYVANAADDSATSVFRVARIPANARVRSVKLTTGDATLAGAVDIGLYDTAENGGAAVDADLFASALDLTGGPFVNSEQIAESAVLTVDKRNKPLWEVLGLTSNPHKFYDIAITVTTTFNGAAVGIHLDVEYVE